MWYCPIFHLDSILTEYHQWGNCTHSQVSPCGWPFSHALMVEPDVAASYMTSLPMKQQWGHRLIGSLFLFFPYWSTMKSGKVAAFRSTLKHVNCVPPSTGNGPKPWYRKVTSLLDPHLYPDDGPQTWKLFRFYWGKKLDEISLEWLIWHPFFDRFCSFWWRSWSILFRLCTSHHSIPQRERKEHDHHGERVKGGHLDSYRALPKLI